MRVWGVRWLPRSSFHGVISPQSFLHKDTRVGELIDTEFKCWKSSVVDSIFLPHEAEAIKCIPWNVLCQKRLSFGNEYFFGGH